MKVSESNIKLINDRLEYLYSNFNIEPFTDEIQIDDDKIFIDFPDEWDMEGIYYSVDDFLRYTENLNVIQVIDNHSVVSGTIRQTIISVNEYYYEHLVPIDLFFYKVLISIQLIDLQ